MGPGHEVGYLHLFSPNFPTSFPGFSPTRPTERARELRRAVRREPWERDCKFSAASSHSGKIIQFSLAVARKNLDILSSSNKIQSNKNCSNTF